MKTDANKLSVASLIAVAKSVQKTAKYFQMHF
jgi:hypothetical protein